MDTQYRWITIFALILIVSVILKIRIISGAGDTDAEVYQQRLQVPPDQFNTFECAASITYSALGVEVKILSQHSSPSRYNLLFLNKTEYRKYLNDEEYTTIWSKLNEETNAFMEDYAGLRNIVQGPYQFVLEHVSGTEMLDVAIVLIFGQSVEGITSIRSTLSYAQYFSTHLPSLFVFGVGIALFLALSAIKRKKCLQSSLKD